MVLIVSSISYYYTSTYNLGNKRKGLLIRFSSLIPVNWSKVEVQITAITPDGEEKLFLGFLNKSELFLDATKGKFCKIVQSWLNHFESDFRKRNFGTSLILDAWIFLDNGTVLATEPCITIPFKPHDVSRGLVIHEIGFELKHLRRMFLQRNSCVFSTRDYVVETTYEWRVVSEYSYITPKGEWDKVPILVVSNPGTYSAEIGYSITLATQQITGFKLTVAYSTGSIIDQAPNVDLRIYVGDFTHKYTYALSEGGDVNPGETLYVYINARIASLYEHEYLVQRTSAGVVIREEPTGNERIREYVLEVEAHDEGDYSVLLDYITYDGKEFEGIMKWFYNGTKEEKLILSNSVYLDDGVLDVGEYVQFGEIFKNYDEYSVNFEIGLPIGAIIAYILVSANPALTPFAMVISGLLVSLSYGYSASIYVDGKLRNCGATEAGEYDVPVYVYMRISKYKYLAPGGYTFKVPAGVMFKILAVTGTGSPGSSPPSGSPVISPTNAK